MSEILHAWVYVIIPVEPNTRERNSFYDGTRALFCAFCKQCRMYFTETIPWDRKTQAPRISPSSLPRFGCSLSEPTGLEELG